MEKRKWYRNYLKNSTEQRILIAISTNFKKQLKELSELRGISMSAFIKYACEDHFRKYNYLLKGEKDNGKI